MTEKLPRPETIGSLPQWVEANRKISQVMRELEARWLKEEPGSPEWNATQQAQVDASRCWTDIKAMRLELINKEIERSSLTRELKDSSDELKRAADAVIDAAKSVEAATALVDRVGRLVTQVNGLLAVLAKFAVLA